MQRGLSEVCTTPSGVCLMASAGQTCAQVGSMQCIQTWGVVCTVWARSIYSRWIMDVPRWVPHSAHACTHAWQPMQRAGSMMNTVSIADSTTYSLPPRSLCWCDCRRRRAVRTSPKWRILDKKVQIQGRSGFGTDERDAIEQAAPQRDIPAHAQAEGFRH